MTAKKLLTKFALFAVFVCAGGLNGADSAKLPFGEKEELVYNVRWSFINVGEAILGLERISTSSWRVYSKARSYRFFDSFHKVRDTVESVWDLDAMRSLRFEKHLSEGKKVTEDLIVIDTTTNMATRKGYEWKITPNALDALSSLHFIRMKPLSVGETITMDVYTKKKLWPLEVKVIKKQKIKVRGKKYRTILVEPEMREEGIFKANGRIWVWLTDDEKRIPVRMNSKVLIGSVSVDLIEVRK